MADESLHVELVTADRVVWSGEATMLIARTVEGDLGVLPNHAPVLSLMVDGIVEVETKKDETWVAAVEAGFLSIADNRVSILSEDAQMSHEIDLEQAKRELEEAQEHGSPNFSAERSLRMARARIRAVERAS
ncbi:MAG: F0F1 ATP synthase subunit epsilon [Nocardioidaceae bacterium]